MKGRPVFPVLLLAVIWGTYYVASQQTVAGMSVFSMGVYIRLIVMVFLTVLMALRGELKLLLQVRFVWPKLVTIGVLGFLLDATAFVGLSLGSASTGTALLKCDILMVAVISAVIYKTRLSWKQWCCIVVMLLGVFITMGLNPAHLELFNLGNLFYLLSALFVSINAFVIKSAQHDKRNPVCDNVVAYYNNFVCMLCFIAASAAAGSLGEIMNCIRTPYYGWMLLLASVGQTLVYIVYYYDLRRFPVWFVKVFLLFMPVVASLICFFAFGEKLTAVQLGGMAVILAGALGILMEQRKNETGSMEPVEERG
ncbi:carboxylate/amino acid/amine transporter [Agathobaculum sp. TL06]